MANPLEIDGQIQNIYRNRFPQETLKQRNSVWMCICQSWLSKYIQPKSAVLEIAAGYCEFINNIEAAEKVAVDINPDVKKFAKEDVITHLIFAHEIAQTFSENHFDIVFMSNFLEHCRSRDDILNLFRAIRIVLKPGGRILILGPNFRFCYKEYFDYFDHHLPLTEKSVVEALEITGFSLMEVYPKTLPFTFRSRLPSWTWLVKLYLKLPFLWRLFGKQFFIVARHSQLQDFYYGV